ncbi:uncharacterized protein CLUP02_00760 [Colletotrichum lupini]|uniref:Uncharacterized protein n=1 Tax=Colletotrichum lupini TaxID=145971 RepID=A0A9Q8SBP2_9PEZI|nr:uncharacterized protein CLUP02_00760 [Colletotrichum lupini]UQC74113.1 hypothetical protein CLUP02_00760 [Colletotrichum lupini]
MVLSEDESQFFLINSLIDDVNLHTPLTSLSDFDINQILSHSSSSR